MFGEAKPPTPLPLATGLKHTNGNAHRSYQVLLFFVYGTTSTTLGATADHYEKQHSSTRNLYVLGVNSVQELSILH